jgi:hypothetical protein
MNAVKRVEAGFYVPDICCELGISAARFYKWRAKYDGMDVPKKELEDGHGVKAVSDQSCRQDGMTGRLHQFRQSAVEMVSPENPIAEVAHSLGIGYSTSDKWVRAHRRQTGQLAALNQEQKRIRELERQVAHLQEVNDTLKRPPSTG